MFSPFYENYGADAILSGAEPVYVPLHPPELNFDADELEAAFRQRPKALILCNPSNPTGKVFTLEELTRSDTAARRGIRNVPDAEAADNLRNLCERVLQPLRDAYGKPVRVGSGYRSPELNRAVGGVAASQHVKGEAADIAIDGVSARDLFNRIVALGIEFDQLILYANFVHVSRKRNRMQKLYAKGVS